MELGNNIKELRKQKGLRQEQLAEAMNVSTASVSKWETNQSYPELTLLAELADFFEVSMDALIGHNLKADRMEALIAVMMRAVDARNDVCAASLCEKLLRNYPNCDRVIDACADAYYRLYISTSKKAYMEHCITQTKRLISLKQGASDHERLAMLSDLGNQYELLGQWDTAKDCYEKSNINGSNDAAIARCLLHQDRPTEAIEKLSAALVEQVFQQYHSINTLADSWLALGDTDKACTALEWMCRVMESLCYNPTTLILLLIKLAPLYEENGKHHEAEAALRKAAAYAKKNDTQEVGAAAAFLKSESSRKMLVSTSGNRELLMQVADTFGSPYAEIIHGALSEPANNT